MSYEEVMVVVDQIEVDDPKDGDYMPPSAQSKPKSTIDLEEKKQLIAAEVKRFPCLWDKKSKYHRIQTKREAAWSQIASEMDMTVNEAKALWKKAKDSHRYHAAKKGKTKSKSGDAAPELDEASDGDAEGEDSVDQLSFLDESASYKYRETCSIGGESSIGPNDDGNTASSSYSYMGRKKRRDESADDADAAKILSQSIASFIEKRQEPKETESKYAATWKQLESYYEQLDDDKITDLNFSFLSQTYSAIVEKRNAKK